MTAGCPWSPASRAGRTARSTTPTPPRRSTHIPARGTDAEIYNVNADTAAAALAVALNAIKLVVLTDVEGLYADWQPGDSASADDVISLLQATELEALLPSLSAGMIPKMEACLRAVRGGVPQAHV